MSLLSTTNSDFAEAQTSHASAAWQSMKDQGHSDKTVQMTSLTSGGTLTVSAGNGIVADYASQGNLQDSLAALAQNPQTAWVAQVAASNNVTWQAVASAHSQWDHESQGLSGPASAIIAIAIAVATDGIGAELAGFAADSTAGVAATAGFSSLVTQATTALIDNQGDLGKTFEQLGSLDTVKNMAISMAEAAALNMAGATGSPDSGSSGADTTGGTPSDGAAPASVDTAGAGGGDLFTTRLENAAIQNAIKAGGTTLTDLANRQSLGQSLESGAISFGVGTAGQVGANYIGDWASPSTPGGGDAPLNDVNHVLAHAALGCAMGAALAGGGCASGATGGAVGELTAGAVNGLTDDPNTIIGASQIAAILATAAFGGNIGVAETTAGNAVNNNYLDHTEAKILADAKDALANCEGCSDEEIAGLQNTVDSLTQISAERDSALLSACRLGSSSCQALQTLANSGLASYEDPSANVVMLSGGVPFQTVLDPDNIAIQAQLTQTQSVVTQADKLSPGTADAAFRNSSLDPFNDPAVQGYIKGSSAGIVVIGTGASCLAGPLTCGVAAGIATDYLASSATNTPTLGASVISSATGFSLNTSGWIYAVLGGTLTAGAGLADGAGAAGLLSLPRTGAGSAAANSTDAVMGALPAPPTGTVQAWSGSITAGKVPEGGMTAYRIWGGGSSQVGSWLSPIPLESTSAAQSLLALPVTNTAEYISVVRVPAGTQIQFGTAASAFGQSGGGVQVQLLERIPLSSFEPGVPLPK